MNHWLELGVKYLLYLFQWAGDKKLFTSLDNCLYGRLISVCSWYSRGIWSRFGSSLLQIVGANNWALTQIFIFANVKFLTPDINLEGLGPDRTFRKMSSQKKLLSYAYCIFFTNDYFRILSFSQTVTFTNFKIKIIICSYKITNKNCSHKHIVNFANGHLCKLLFSKKKTVIFTQIFTKLTEKQNAVNGI